MKDSAILYKIVRDRELQAKREEQNIRIIRI